MNNFNKYKQQIKLSQKQLDDLFDIDILEQEEEQTEQQDSEHLDTLLDEYNSYKFLYTMFDDEDYKKKAESTMNRIKSMFGSK